MLVLWVIIIINHHQLLIFMPQLYDFMQINTSFVYGNHVYDIYYYLEDYNGEVRSNEFRIGLIFFYLSQNVCCVKGNDLHMVVKLNFYLGFPKLDDMMLCKLLFKIDGLLVTNQFSLFV
jgi:hypothetical protein